MGCGGLWRVVGSSCGGLWRVVARCGWVVVSCGKLWAQVVVSCGSSSTFHQTWVRTVLSLRTPLRFRLFAGARLCQVRSITLPRTTLAVPHPLASHFLVLRGRAADLCALAGGNGHRPAPSRRLKGVDDHAPWRSSRPPAPLPVPWTTCR